MKKLIVVCFCLASCGPIHLKQTIETFTFRVVYQDSSIDTIQHIYTNCYQDRPAVDYIKISENGIISSSLTPACLMVGSGFYSTVVACGVRKYSVINKTIKVVE